MADNKLAIPDRLVEMAWEDRTPFEAIKLQFGVSEGEVITMIRNALSPSGFRRWRKRVKGRKTKHLALRDFRSGRHKSPMQKIISNNAISKR